MPTTPLPQTGNSTDSLRKSEVHLTGILESTADAILAVDSAGKVIRANRRFMQLWGIPQALMESGDDSAMLAFVLDQLVDPEAFLERVRALYASTAEDMDTLHFKDGRIVERYSSPLLLEGALIGRVWSFRDVTRQRKAEAAVQESETRLRAMLEAILVPAGLVTGNGSIAYFNEALQKTFGYVAQDMPTVQAWQELAFPDPAYRDWVRAQRAERLARIAAGERDLPPIEVDITCKDGSVRTCLISWNLAGGIDGNAVMSTFFDITPRKQAEEAASRHLAHLERTFMQTVGLVSALGEVRDPYTANHERRVADLAHAIGVELGLETATLEGLRVSGYLHDVGNMNIPGEILSKPGPLSAVETKIVRTHARAGHDVLKTVDFPWPVAQVALQHHERLDGSGYPDGLKGEQIIFEARIITVAEVVEAMASHRPYRPARDIAEALAEIEQGRDRLYDARVVDACLRLFRDKGYVLPRMQFQS